MTRPTKRRGSAALTAVTLIGLVGVMIAALASLFAAEARRTRDAAAEAQLRQLLVAGAWVANERVRGASPVTESSIELPASLTADGARVTLAAAPAPDANTVLINVNAALGEREMSQSLRFVRRDAQWRLAEATLNP